MTHAIMFPPRTLIWITLILSYSIYIVKIEASSAATFSPITKSKTTYSTTATLLRISGGDSSNSVDREDGDGDSNTKKRKIVIGVDGGTESIRACCFDAINGNVIGKSHAVPYKTSHPKPGWAEQNPKDWYDNLGAAVKGALASIPSDNGDEHELCAICVDTTCCSVVALDSSNEPLRPCLLWMDARSAPQTKEILDRCKGDPSLLINSGGEGPISAEWLIPKSLWIKQNEPDIWDKASTICEYQDYINFKLTGKMVASSCNAAVRWHWDGEECLREVTNDDNDEERYPGRPLSMYRALGMPELVEKLPHKCLPMGSLVGGLTSEAANDLGLPEGLPVVQGGPDAFVGMIGLGCIYPGQLCLITGSSHLHCVVTAQPNTAPGTWGAYRGAPLQGTNFAEGGQSSTGSVIRWAKALFAGDDTDYKTLDAEAEKLPPGSENLIALDTFQGSRTPVTDPLARGALVGMTLSHTRGHIWRALMEAVCFGTRACVDGLVSAGHECSEIIIAGGATRSPVWLQMHADVTGKPVVLCENADAPLLGCAILASVGAGIHHNVEDAVESMVRRLRRIEPRGDVAAEYEKIYENVYVKLSQMARPVMHAIAGLRGGGSNGRKLVKSGERTDRNIAVYWGLLGNRKMQRLLEDQSFSFFSKEVWPSLFLRGGDTESASNVPEKKKQDEKKYDHTPIISPSLLASDWSDIRSEINRCVVANVTHLHIDVFDGVFLDSPYAFTFGPQMVEAMRQCYDNVTLDIHLCVDRPVRYIKPMADAGATRFIFQWEAMTGNSTLAAALDIAQEVNNNGMKCGVSINPSTPVEDILPLLESGLVDMVDVLAVEPGFGGQSFQDSALLKLRKLREWRASARVLSGNDMSHVKFMVDGGINTNTSSLVTEAGADIMVAGTFLFRHPRGLSQGVKELLDSSCSAK